MPIRGGNWNNDSNAGLGALNLNYERSNVNSNLGFRPALACRQIGNFHGSDFGVQAKGALLLCQTARTGCKTHWRQVSVIRESGRCLNGIGENMQEFQPTDFVQVECPILHDSGEPGYTWRNALYVMQQKGSHVVIYTDGTKEVLNHNTRIRKPA